MYRASYAFVLLSAIQLFTSTNALAFQAEDGSGADSVYSWLVTSGPKLPPVRQEAETFLVSRLTVFVDSVEIDGVRRYRVLLGTYPTRKEAARDEVLVPMTVRNQASIVALNAMPKPYFETRRPVELEHLMEGAAGKTSMDQQVEDQVLAKVKKDAAKEVSVFLDCSDCDEDFVKREINFVNYVVDRGDANVHVLVTKQNSGGGIEYNLRFIGLDRFAGLSDTLSYASSDTDTDAERRDGLTRRIRLGLIRYVARTGLAGALIVKLSSVDNKRLIRPEEDVWKFWRFKVSMSGSYSGEQSKQSYEIGGTLRADRVIDEWKMRFSTKGDYKKSQYDVDDETITSTKRSGSANAFVINSLAGRWSAGTFGSVSTSSFKNTNYSVTFSPALEYTIFPYSESSNKEFRLSYYVNFHHFDYEKLTVFEKSSEDVLGHELQAHLEVRQPWGTALATLSASNYLTDFDKSLRDLYNIELYAYFEVRVVRGLSLWFEGTASRIRDQIYLPQKKASPEDILLGTVSLPTDYAYNLSAGLVFTFGSIYNSIVNPRFGS